MFLIIFARLNTSQTLSDADTHLSSAEFTSYLHASLKNDYDALVTFVIARLELMAPRKLYNLLLASESRLAHFTHLPMSTIL